MAEYLGDLFESQAGPMGVEIWIEPFAGGAGAGLALLDSGQIGELWLVEKNPALAALWRIMIEQGEALARRVSATTPTMYVWHAASETMSAAAAGETLDDLDLGYAAFIINRCSRSGIVAANVGPIGGKNQTGRWGIGARFNAQALADRIRHVASFADNMRVIEGDGVNYVENLAGSGIEDEVMLFVDPPYIREGNRLYTHGMSSTDLRGSLTPSTVAQRFGC